MIKFFLAERLKLKRTISKKILLFSPCLIALLTIRLPDYIFTTGYNWWYAMIFPGVLTLFICLVQQQEERKLAYQAVYPLSVSLKRFWLGKISVIAYYMGLAELLHLGLLLLVKYSLFPTQGENQELWRLVLASLVLVFTALWQIPFCLWLAKKTGTIVTLLINLVLNIGAGIIFATSSFWWLCPYSWGIRLMVPILNILPNGLPAGTDAVVAPKLPTSSWSMLLAVCLSAILLIFLSHLTASWFSKQEVKS
ncbi:lantibiotic immunity ABC transporter MutE/EpiE family permease subunit [Streptococcus sobrinus]|uniref:lantibiotic immunity ABC transporter MutE/EpiE family permease subunit n=2 Tax=Streptococcus sobrinus TaxID=1310 RepID=UPI0002FEE25B|nr:lantibiotic immunity ABC transporter MutE/EpiE family permease subunit [Streptococcus sobrinus]AWN18624.1 lantibiotic immunity ABC transporter MutE/EpiE family permease subunit [Streptococcus sobrinus]